MPAPYLRKVALRHGREAPFPRQGSTRVPGTLGLSTGAYQLLISVIKPGFVPATSRSWVFCLLHPRKSMCKEERQGRASARRSPPAQQPRKQAGHGCGTDAPPRMASAGSSDGRLRKLCPAGSCTFPVPAEPRAQRQRPLPSTPAATASRGTGACAAPELNCPQPFSPHQMNIKKK